MIFSPPSAFLRVALLAILSAVVSLHAAPAAAPLPAIRVQQEGHYLETTDGRPFFWLGDTAWTLLQGTTHEESAYYLRTRAHQGFTIIQVVALGFGESRDDAVGTEAQRPFLNRDPSRPNPAYFDRLARLVDDAAAAGLYVALLPAWGDQLRAPLESGGRLFRLDNLPVVRAYGKFIAERLKGRTNIVWMLGGDTPSKLDPTKPNDHPQKAAIEQGFAPDYDWRPIWREMAAGITEGFGAKPLLMYHPEGAGGSSPNLHAESWLALNGLQSGHSEHDAPVWLDVKRDYALTPTKPTLDLEPNYEDHPVHPWPRWDPAYGYFRDHDIRKQSYRSVLAGACGVTYGHHAVWPFVGERNDVRNHTDRDWIDAMHRPGARQMIFLRQLIESRPFFTRVPDPSLVRNAADVPALHVEASRDRNSSYALIYFPERDQRVTVDLAKLRGKKLHAWWYDPRTGFPHDLGLIDGGKEKEFTSPMYGPDWVLVLDDAEVGYAAPGVLSR